MSSPLKNASTVSYTPAETKLINLAFKHMKSVPDINWAALAVDYGYQDARVARNKYVSAMNKYKNMGDDPATNPDTDIPTPTKPKRQKRKERADSPTRGVKSGRKNKAAKIVEVDEEKDDTEVDAQRLSEAEAKEETKFKAEPGQEDDEVA